MERSELLSGFTLLELLVVLVILGMGVGFALPKLWGAYVKMQERGVVQSLSLKLQRMRMDAYKGGKMVRWGYQTTGEGGLPAGWEIVSASKLQFLPSGVTNGGKIVLRSPSSHFWKLVLQPLDGRVSIRRSLAAAN